MKRMLLWFFSLVYSIAFAQIDITYPNKNAVFQRNNANEGLIHFGGNYTVKLDRIEARLVALNGGTYLDWTTVITNPTKGFYRAELWAKGGWYRVEVRGIRNNETIAQSALEPIGLGEVFVVSGQSNAQGFEGIDTKGATDERVVCINNFFAYSYNTHPFPTFSKIEAHSRIAPTGLNAWCWGELGDLLARRLNVPILFINTAFDGLQIDAWVTSANGGYGINPFSGTPMPIGYPFNSLKNSLQQYITQLGIRAILFHQGETDGFLRTAEEEYYQKLIKTIENSRNVSGRYVSWVVSRATKSEFLGRYDPVINAQNRVITSYGNVFAGPDTDNIHDRADGVHFNSAGLTKLANEWNASLNEHFFNNSVPHLAISPILPNSYCNSANFQQPISLSLPDGFSSYYWNESIQSKTLDVNQGYFQGKVVDYLGNTYFSVPVKFTQSLVPAKPVVSTNQETTFCEGNSIQLSTNNDYGNYWSNGATTREITIGGGGEYSVSHVNVFGCIEVSAPFKITVNPTPKPIVTLSGPSIICSNEKLRLTSNYDFGNFWSNGENVKAIELDGKQEIFLKVKNDFGCEGTSETIHVDIRPAAEKPTIKLNGFTEFCSDQKAILLGKSKYGNYQWSSGEINDSIEVYRTGNYFLKTKNQFGCEANSDTIKIKVNAVPDKPVITLKGSSYFCDSEMAELVSTENYAYKWNVGKTTQAIKVNITGNYSLKVVSPEGCTSVSSDPIFLKVYETPNKPIIVSAGVYTLESFGAAYQENKTYEWLFNDILLDKNTPSIKAISNGSYKVKISEKFITADNKELICSSPISEPYTFILSSTDVGYNIFPNPVIDKTINIETLEDVDNSNVTLYDFTGRVVKSFHVPIFDTKKIFDVSDLHAGEYLIQLRNNRYKAVKKIIIE